MHFGRRVCGVALPAAVLQCIAQGMQQALQAARGDERIAKPLLAAMQEAWASGMWHAS